MITADALHCQRAHASWLHERRAGFVFTVTHNQPGLFDALNALPWTDTPITHRQLDRGHGRITTHTIQVLPAPPDPPFPHLNQVWLIERYVTDTTGTPISAIAVLGVTNLPADLAGPAELAGYVREHWGIESLHWLRDTIYGEDDSRARRVLATTLRTTTSRGHTKRCNCVHPVRKRMFPRRSTARSGVALSLAD